MAAGTSTNGLTHKIPGYVDFERHISNFILFFKFIHGIRKCARLLWFWGFLFASKLMDAKQQDPPGLHLVVNAVKEFSLYGRFEFG